MVLLDPGHQTSVRVFARIHGATVHRRRVDRIAAAISHLPPSGARILDVGAGDGRLAAALMELRPDLQIECIDTIVRPEAVMKVRQYDGQELPYETDAFDYAMLVDVLHHATDHHRLLNEVKRVAATGLLVKDHCRESVLDQVTLSAMDWVGNSCHGIPRTYKYLSRAEWQDTAFQLAGTWSTWQSTLALYRAPISWICDRRLHFVGRLDWDTHEDSS